MVRETLNMSNLLLLGTVVALTLSGCSKDDDSDNNLKDVSCFAANPLLLQQLQHSNLPSSDASVAQSSGGDENQLAIASTQPGASSFDDFDEDFFERRSDEFIDHRDFQEQVLNLPGIRPGRINFGSALNRDDDHDFGRDDVFFPGRFEDRFEDRFEYGFEDRFDD